MVTLADVRRWNPAGLEASLATLTAAQQKLVELDFALADARPPAGWLGVAADGARAEQERLAERLRRFTAGVAAVRPGVAEAADAIGGLHRGIEAADGLARTHGFAVAADGTVTDVAPPVVPADQVEQVRRERAAAQAEIVDRIGQVLRQAAAIDAALADVLRRAATEQVDDGPGATLAGAAQTGAGAGDLPAPTPPPDASVGDAVGWWDSLSDARRAEVVAEHPEQVGNLDGIPALVRDDANRAVLDRTIAADAARAEQIRDRLAELAQGPVHGPGYHVTPQGIERDRLTTELAAIEERTAGTTAIKARLDAGGYLLGFEPHAGNGRAIVATGNPDLAHNVVTHVPGTTARLGTIGGDLARVDAVVQSAQRADASATTVGVTWYDYDAPQSLYTDAPREVFADEARPHLRSFQEGLRATHDGDPSHNTVIAHSYGTTVVGHTARDGGLDADALVFAGSPGVGVEHVSELNRPPGTVYSTTSANDEIAIANLRWESPDGNPIADALGRSLDAHGRDPSSADFGAEVFAADPAGGHSDYWTNINGRDNPALDSFGRIAVGKEPLP